MKIKLIAVVLTTALAFSVQGKVENGKIAIGVYKTGRVMAESPFSTILRLYVEAKFKDSSHWESEQSSLLLASLDKRKTPSFHSTPWLSDSFSDDQSATWGSYPTDCIRNLFISFWSGGGC